MDFKDAGSMGTDFVASCISCRMICIPVHWQYQLTLEYIIGCIVGSVECQVNEHCA